jgi:NAD(P)-dependent dehydrogenase (short-subunit alcohol dehydrogenase family)
MNKNNDITDADINAFSEEAAGAGDREGVLVCCVATGWSRAEIADHFSDRWSETKVDIRRQVAKATKGARRAGCRAMVREWIETARSEAADRRAEMRASAAACDARYEVRQ